MRSVPSARRVGGNLVVWSIGLLLVLGILPPAGANVVADGPKVLTPVLEAVPGGYQAVVEIPFHLATAGQIGVKVHATPASPIHDTSSPNGTVTADHDAGVSGWWVSFTLHDASGAIGDEPWSVHADEDESSLRPVATGANLSVRATIHAPEAAVPLGSKDSVHIAIIYHEGSGRGSSGGSYTPSITTRVVLSDPTGGSSDSPTSTDADDTDGGSMGSGSLAGANGDSFGWPDLASTEGQALIGLLTVVLGTLLIGARLRTLGRRARIDDALWRIERRLEAMEAPRETSGSDDSGASSGEDQTAKFPDQPGA